jgi:hypothetical protein
MNEKPEEFAPVRLEVLVNGKRRAILGVGLGGFVSAGVMQTDPGSGEIKSDLVLFGRPDNAKPNARPWEDSWQRGTILNGIGDEVVIRVVGPGPYEAPPTKFFPMPPQFPGQESR